MFESALIELVIKVGGGLLALIIGVVGVWLAGRLSGKKSADLESAHAAAEQADNNRRTRHDADRNARNDDDPAGSLRDKWSRD